MLLREMFDKVLPWEWYHKDEEGQMANFAVSDNVGYHVVIDKVGPEHEDSWEVVFTRSEMTSDWKVDSSTSVTGTGKGDEYAVLATVIDIIKSFMKDKDPDVLYFTAKSDEPSRVSLYRKMLGQLTSGKYETETSMDDNNWHFIIKKKEQDRAA